MEAGSGVIDQAVFDELRTVMGELFPKVVLSTIQSVERSMAEIEKAFENNDSDAVFKAAHAMKSVSAQLGALAFSELAKQVEMASRAGHCEEAEVFFPKTQEECQKMLLFLEGLPSASQV